MENPTTQKPKPIVSRALSPVLSFGTRRHALFYSQSTFRAIPTSILPSPLHAICSTSTLKFMTWKGPE